MVSKNASEAKLILSLLEYIIPFRFLTQEQRIDLLDDLTGHAFYAGETIIRQGDEADDSVYLLLEGSVETLDRTQQPVSRLNVITPGHYFGERSVLFAHPRSFEIRALDPVRCYSLPGERFLHLIQESRAFALSLGSILRDKQGVFDAFDRFTSELLHTVARGYINIPRLVPLYQELEPALHPKVNDRSEIDFSALTYAVNRLPTNVTDTFAFFLTDELPPLYSKPDQTFRSISTTARRRDIYEMLPGKNMVLLRNGLSDLIDLVTCLCLFTVEARKIRSRLRNPASLLAINNFLRSVQPERTGSGGSLEVDPGPSADSTQPSVSEREQAFLRSLSFSEDEAKGLYRVWPGDAVARLHKISLHHEDFGIEIRRQTNNYNSRHSELWTNEIGRATRQLLGYDPTALPSDFKVHIISSNTHSVTNCLNPSLIEQADEILAWGHQVGHKLTTEDWTHQFDLVYALARDYWVAHPEMAAASREFEQVCGILRLHETVCTGIQVQLIDTQQLFRRPIDPGISPIPDSMPALIVNIDYAFGEQAEEIIRNLLTLFGRNLASVNILGKAGALKGNRGDLILPTAFVEQTTDIFQTLPSPNTLEVDRLQKRVPDRAIHAGPMLTVAGTLLQNRLMLHFYRHIWGCIGLEMEGAFYCRQILEARQLGVTASDIDLRFLYYVSDLPLEHDATLSVSLRAIEGIPPLYAITREILSGIFE